jgi:hypothetical protein
MNKPVGYREMLDKDGIMDILGGDKNKFLALLLCLIVSIYVTIPDNAYNSDTNRNNVDCTGLIAVNQAQFA